MGGEGGGIAQKLHSYSSSPSYPGFEFWQIFLNTARFVDSIVMLKLGFLQMQFAGRGPELCTIKN